MQFVFMAYCTYCNSEKTVKEKLITSATTMKEKQFGWVLTSLDIYFFITITSTNSACLLTRLRVQTINENHKRELQNAVSDRQQKKSFLFFPPFLAFQTNKKNPQLECLHYILSRGKWLHKHRKQHNWSTELIKKK